MPPKFKPGRNSLKKAGHVHAGLLDTNPSKNSKFAFNEILTPSLGEVVHRSRQI
jgi:hypothetical protein